MNTENKERALKICLFTTTQYLAFEVYTDKNCGSNCLLI